MPDDFASAFVNTFGQMQQNKRQNALAESEIAQRLAEQHWRDSEAAVRQQVANWAQDPTNPDNRYKAALTEDVTTRAPEREANRLRLEEKDRGNLAARNKQLDQREKKADEENQYKRIKDAIATMAKEGTPAGMAMQELMPDDRPAFQLAITNLQKFTRNAKRDALVRSKVEAAQSNRANVFGQAIGAGAAQGEMGPMGAMSVGDPLGAAMGAMTGAAGALQQGTAGQSDPEILAKAHYDAQKELEASDGPEPGPEDWQKWVHPGWTARQEMEVEKVAKMRAQAELAGSRARRENGRALLDPKYLELRQLAERDRNDIANGRLTLATNAQADKEIFENNKLNVEKARNKIAQQNADANTKRTNSYAWTHSKEGLRYLGDIQQRTARIRSLATDELHFTEKELLSEQKQLYNIEQQENQHRDVLATIQEVQEATGFGIKGFGPFYGSKTVLRVVDPNNPADQSKWRPLNKLEQTIYDLRNVNAPDLDETNPTGIKHRVLELKQRVDDLRDVSTRSAEDAQVTLDNGKVVPPGKPTPGRTAPAATATGQPQQPTRISTDAEWAKLPKGARFIGPDNKVRIK